MLLQTLFCTSGLPDFQREGDDVKVRVKFGKNPYSNRFSCSRCGSKFDSGGFFLRIEHYGTVVDIPICKRCYEADAFYEGIIDLTAHYEAHPIGLA